MNSGPGHLTEKTVQVAWFDVSNVCYTMEVGFPMVIPNRRELQLANPRCQNVCTTIEKGPSLSLAMVQYNDTSRMMPSIEMVLSFF